MKLKRRYIFNLIIVFFILLTLAGIRYESHRQSVKTQNKTALFNVVKTDDEFSVSKDYSYKNLSIFFLSRTDKNSYNEYKTLEQAIDNNLISVMESETVNSVYIQNNSNYFIYINAGELLKGGKQDRILINDAIVPPHINLMSLDCYCAEKDRWSQRSADESESYFKKSNKMVVSSNLFKVKNSNNGQYAMWYSISDFQTNINQNLLTFFGKQVDIRKNKSGSSLALSLNDPEFNQIIGEYRQNIIKSIDLRNICGMAVRINGRICSINIYSSNQLFMDLFDKSLDAAISEAINSLNESYDGRDNLAYLTRLLKSEFTLVSSDHSRRNTAYEVYAIEPELKRYSTIDRFRRQWVHISYDFEAY